MLSSKGNYFLSFLPNNLEFHFMSVKNVSSHFLKNVWSDFVHVETFWRELDWSYLVALDCCRNGQFFWIKISSGVRKMYSFFSHFLLKEFFSTINGRIFESFSVIFGSASFFEGRFRLCVKIFCCLQISMSSHLGLCSFYFCKNMLQTANWWFDWAVFKSISILVIWFLLR